MHVCIHMHEHVYTMHMHVDINIYIRVLMKLCIYIHMHTCTFIHDFAHTCTHSAYKSNNSLYMHMHATSSNLSIHVRPI